MASGVVKTLGRRRVVIGWFFALVFGGLLVALSYWYDNGNRAHWGGNAIIVLTFGLFNLFWIVDLFVSSQVMAMLNVPADNPSVLIVCMFVTFTVYGAALFFVVAKLVVTPILSRGSE